MKAVRSVVDPKCSTCGLPVYADQGYYTITGEHWDCHEGNAAALKRLLTKGETKRTNRPRGTGKLATKVTDMISKALESLYEVKPTDLTLYLNPPVWNQARFDVHRFEGNARINGRLISFASWYTLTELAKHRKLKFSSDRRMEISPQLTKKKAKS